MQIAYITYENVGKYVSSVEDEDVILWSYLKKNGLPITEEIWTDENVKWENYTHAILKSPWDYFDKYPAFLKWLNKIGGLGIKVLNPIDVIKWNSNKHYLLDIAKAGLKVTPTEYLEQHTLPQLQAYFNFFDSKELVIKPVVSGGSKNTFRFNAENVKEIQEQIYPLLKEEAYMVQPFIEEIATDGEWSFIFFNNTYSHSLLKKAKEGDFRVQHYLGGTIHPQNPPLQQVEAIQPYVDQFAKCCLYARVDGYYRNGEFYLMELELIEPFLFLFTDSRSYQHYLEALRRLLIPSSFFVDQAHN